MNVINRNNVRVSGEGAQTIIFAHGYGCDQAMWRKVSPSFEDEYRVVLFDYVGAGLSDPDAYDPVRYSSLAGYAKDIVEICTALDLQNAILVGHSVSSMIGLLAAIEIPHRISKLVMICPTPRYLNDLPDYIGGFEHADIEGLLDMISRNQPGWASHLAGIIAKNPELPELAQELDASFCAMDPPIAKRFAKATFFADNRSDLVGFDKPCLLLQCQEDSVAPNVVGDYLHQHLLNSSLQQMKATGHCPHMSHPLETIQLIKKYLAS
ncbi:MAG: sigma-B regulation protein RsbQ [Paraglaciecola sp.]|jgi:sigma-B regulation protein RsbQ